MRRWKGRDGEGGWDDMMRYDGMEGWSFLFNFVQVVLFSFVCRDIGGKRFLGVL